MSDPLAANAARAIAFETWMNNVGLAPARWAPERPEHELLAEHYMMGLATSAMEEEAQQLLRGASLRPAFWQQVVDYIGNFTHRVHRVKEEEVFFPALAEWGLLIPEDKEHFEADHRALGDLTRDLCDGVGEGDWEKAFRVVSIYLGRIRPHLAAEEVRLLSPEVAKIPTKDLAPISRRFREIEAEALGSEGRNRIVTLTQGICRSVGLAELHAEIDTW